MSSLLTRARKDQVRQFVNLLNPDNPVKVIRAADKRWFPYIRVRERRPCKWVPLDWYEFLRMVDDKELRKSESSYGSMTYKRKKR